MTLRSVRPQASKAWTSASAMKQGDAAGAQSAPVGFPDWLTAVHWLVICGESTERNTSGSRRLDAPNRGDPIDGAVERRYRFHAAGFCACDEVGLGEVDPVDLVDLEGAQE